MKWTSEQIISHYEYLRCLVKKERQTIPVWCAFLTSPRTRRRYTGVQLRYTWDEKSIQPVTNTEVIAGGLGRRHISNQALLNSPSALSSLVHSRRIVFEKSHFKIIYDVWSVFSLNSLSYMFMLADCETKFFHCYAHLLEEWSSTWPIETAVSHG